MTATHDKPLAAAGLISYRYRGRYGFVMIGAHDDADALKQANRSLSTPDATIDRLEIYSAADLRYVPVQPK